MAAADFVLSSPRSVDDVDMGGNGGAGGGDISLVRSLMTQVRGVSQQAECVRKDLDGVHLDCVLKFQARCKNILHSTPLITIACPGPAFFLNRYIRISL